MNTRKDPAGDLCCYCSMCCNGSIFSHAKLDDEERAQLGDRVDYEEIKGGLRLRFPCRQLGDDGACKTYLARPAICWSFRCLLLKDLDSGKVEFEAATRIVDDAKQLRARLMEMIAEAGENIPEVIAEKRVSRAVRRLKKARSDGEAAIDAFLFKRVDVHFALYQTFIQRFFSKKYK